MADQSDFKRNEFCGDRIAHASVTNTPESFSVTRSTVSKVMTAFEKEGKTFSLKQNSGRERKLSDRDLRTLTQFVRKGQKDTVPKITVELNDPLEKSVSSKTVRELLKAGFTGWQQLEKTYQNEFIWNFQAFPLFRPTPIYIYIYIEREREGERKYVLSLYRQIKDRFIESLFDWTKSIWSAFFH